MDCKPSDFFMKDPINVHIFELGKEISVLNKTNKEKPLQFQNLFMDSCFHSSYASRQRLSRSEEKSCYETCFRKLIRLIARAIC